MRSRSSYRAVAFSFLASPIQLSIRMPNREGDGWLQTSTPSEIAITIAEDSDQNVPSGIEHPVDADARRIADDGGTRFTQVLN